jgi:HYD1 signature containing ADP-ribosyltransferase
MVVYHYTSESSLMGIVTSNEFYPSYLNPQMDTAFGEGWYFTDLNPNTTPNEDLEQSLWQRSEPVKSRRYIAFEIHDSLLQKCRDNVYRLKIEAITEGVIKLNLTYTFTSTSAQAIKYITHGHKQIVYRPYRPNNPGNPWGTLGVFALIILGLAALSK